MGLGRMGTLMAANLARAGLPLTVYNRTMAAAEAFVASYGGELAASPAQIAASSDVLITMLADGDALIEIYTMPGGVLEGIRPGTMAVDMGTSGPVALQEIRGPIEGAGACSWTRQSRGARRRPRPASS